MKGSVVDMAVGIIIGGAFKTIVSAMVDGVLMPVVGKFMGGVDFSQLILDLSGQGHSTLSAAKEAGASVIAYGTFVQAIIDFLIIAACLFAVIKAMNAAKKKEEEAPAEPPAPPAQEVLLAEIRDLLKK